MLLYSFYALIGSLGFGIIFNIRGKNLIIASLGGGFAWIFFKLSSAAGLSTSSSLFMATVGVSIYSEIMAIFMKTPVTIFVICSIIPLVPGSGMYYTTFQSVQGNINKSLTLGIETLFNAAAIAIGITLVSSISKILKQKNIHKKKKTYL